MSELKPCPFCGAEEEDIAFIESYLPFTSSFRGFYCRKCGGALFSKNLRHNYNDLVTLWNRRMSTTEVNQFGENNMHITNLGTLNL